MTRVLIAGPAAAPACPECDGWGRFWTINKDGRYGPLWPRTLPCPDCGGSGRRTRAAAVTVIEVTG